jgi:hypothetical protein
VKALLLFLLTSVLGGLGGVAGVYGGAAVGPGAGIFLQFLAGSALTVGAVLLAVRFRLIRTSQRGWTVAGGILGVGMAALVTLSTLSSAVAPYLTPMLVGMGATLASLIGGSAHESDLT